MEKLDFGKLDEIDIVLKKNINNLRNLGILIFLLTVGLGIYLFFDFKHITEQQVEIINNSKFETETLIYLLFRTSALASVVTTGLIFSFKMATQSFDQSMRFVKRKIAANYLRFLYSNHRRQFEGEITLEQIMSSFWVWNLNVESAFTTNKKKDYKPGSIFPNFIFKKSDGGELSSNNDNKSK